MATVAPQLIGESALFHALLDRVSDLAALDRPLLVVGERGTGKEIIASRVHFLSPRWEQTYIRVNCAAFTEEALEVELFGDGHSDGRIQAADGGTLFLDNIDVTPIWMQEKFLRLLEHGEFEPPESQTTETVNVRFIAAAAPTGALSTKVKRGDLSAELLDRLAAHVLTLPPLRARQDDIPSLVTYFGRKIVSLLGADQFPGLTPEALTYLQALPWPGNVRELKNIIDRSTAEAFLQDEALSAPIHNLALNPFETTWDKQNVNEGRPSEAQIVTETEIETAQPELDTYDFSERVMAFERGLIDQALSLHDHHQGKAADYLGLSYHQFRGLLRKHGLKK